MNHSATYLILNTYSLSNVHTKKALKSEIKTCLKNKMNVGITVKQASDIEFLKEICSLINGTNTQILIESDTYETIDIETLHTLIDNVLKIKETYNIDMLFQEGFSIGEALIATSRVDSWVEEIQNARINGKELSPFEKYIYAYNIATNFVYKAEGQNDLAYASRNINSVLTSDKIVCVGFASLLKCLCDKLNIECEMESLRMIDKKTSIQSGHSTLCVKLKDPKYNLNGIYMADPTADCLNKKTNRTRTAHALIPYDQIDKVYKNHIVSVDHYHTNYGYVRRQLFDNGEVKLKDKFVDILKKEISEQLDKNIDYNEYKTNNEKLLELDRKFIKNDVHYALDLYELEQKIKENKFTTIKELVDEHMEKVISNIKTTCEVSSLVYGMKPTQIKSIVKKTLKNVKMFEYVGLQDIPVLYNFIDRKISAQSYITEKNMLLALYNVELAKGQDKQTAKEKAVFKMIENSIHFNPFKNLSSAIKKCKESGYDHSQIYSLLQKSFNKVIDQHEQSSQDITK